MKSKELEKFAKDLFKLNHKEFEERRKKMAWKLFEALKRCEPLPRVAPESEDEEFTNTWE